MSRASAQPLWLQLYMIRDRASWQLDGVPSSAAALPRIVKAVGNRLTVLANGDAVGSDVVRMHALGAKGAPRA